ncbi:Gfo/Idh/MocA family protein [Bacillus sp. SD088]|uniref:Gfo/Idh/MocA family protein n=1 Tax=Bacillus sp. SD088 TaxID=2782012 RepID=UPI001A961010|nr:Gfo/Idh/MocA family oxidoreductase [Bacillus sp. SD088]MBO0991709.1 Gfo/Idh/MocA family oxidoreductase [Bacillus sp. SD088]
MEKVKVGFIGVGGIGSVHLKSVAANKEAEIVAICDVNAVTAESQAKKLGISTFYTDADTLLENETLDALFVCVPPFAHGDIEEKAAARGIHLFIEKPVALDLKTAHAKADAIEAAGIINASGYCLRYIDVLPKANEYLKDKKIAMVRGQYLGGFVPTPWFREKDKSGGQLVEQSTHVMDLMRYLAGDIERVSADMSLQVLNEIENIDIPDVSSINCRFASGAVGHLDCTLTQPDFRTGVEILGKDFRVEVTFSTVTIIEDGKRIEYRTNKDFYVEQDNAFIEAVRTGNPGLIRATYTDGLKTLAVTLAANQSAETGETVSLDSYSHSALSI